MQKIYQYNSYYIPLQAKMVLYMILTSYYTLKVAISVSSSTLLVPDNLSPMNSKNWSFSSTQANFG